MKNKYILNSMGRCGSTILFEFVYGYYLKYRVDFHTSEKKFLPCISERSGSGKIEVWKTHDRNIPTNLTDNLFFAYQFGNPLNTLLSTVYSPVLARKIHIGKHLQVDTSWIGTDKWIYEDVLKLEEHFDNWTKPIGRPILLIKYEDMWGNLDKICDYFEIPRSYAKNFPQKKARIFKYEASPSRVRGQLMKTYGSLYEKIESFSGVSEI